MNLTNRLIRYFDLFSSYRTTQALGQSSTSPQAPGAGWLFAHYGALFLGIVSKVFLDSLEGGQFHFSWTRTIVALITATAIFPAVYEKAMGSTGPSFVQLCVTFTSGLGYKTLIDIKV